MLAEPVKHREIFGFGIKKGNQTICKWRHLLTVQLALYLLFNYSDLLF
jgi:hypothetical protein